MITFGQKTPKLISIIKEQRRQAYARESDPLYFKWQRGEATQEEYLASIEDIKMRYPYPEGYTP